jgi:hypothetical protein
MVIYKISLSEETNSALPTKDPEFSISDKSLLTRVTPTSQRSAISPANFSTCMILYKSKFCLITYQVDSFYVELFYQGQQNMISKLRSFSSTTQLEPYLEAVDISGIKDII